MFEKEIRKLKLLTEKLDAQGDVSEDEADYIYMLRKLSKAGMKLYTIEMIEDGTSVIKNAYDDRALIKSIQKSIETSKSFVAVFIQSIAEAKRRARRR